MSKQLLWFPKDDRSIQERFEEFDAAHPDVWELFLTFAKQLRAAGREYYGARMIWERIRWHFATTHPASETEPKLNDHYVSRYARKLAQVPGFENFLELRNLRSA